MLPHRNNIHPQKLFIDIQEHANLALCLQAPFISTNFSLSSPPGQVASREEHYELMNDLSLVKQSIDANLSGLHFPFHDPLHYTAQLKWSKSVSRHHCDGCPITV